MAGNGQQNFIEEPLGEKDVDVLPGIGAVNAMKMEEKGVGKVRAEALSQLHLLRRRTFCSANI